MMSVEIVQGRVKRWILDTFGPETQANSGERALRLLEEALELAQSVHVPSEQAHKLVDYVYSRPVGEPSQELAGCMVTLLGAAGALDIQLAEVTLKELDRIETPQIQEKCRRRQAEKREAQMVQESLSEKSRANTYYHGPVWASFNLSRASFFVMSRRMLQSMPYAWQERFVATIREAYEFLNTSEEETQRYVVQVRDDAGRLSDSTMGDYRHAGPLPRRSK